MPSIAPDNDAAKLIRDKKWIKRRVKQLYGANWSGKTDSEKIEALQDVVAPMARALLTLLNDDYEEES